MSFEWAIEKSRTNKDTNVTWCEWFSYEFYIQMNRMFRSTAVTAINSIIPTSNTKHMNTNGYVCSLLIVLPVIRWEYGLFRTLWDPLSIVVTAQVRTVSICVNTVSSGYHTYPKFSGFSREISDWFIVILSLNGGHYYVQKYLFTISSPRLKFNFYRPRQVIKFLQISQFSAKKKECTPVLQRREER
jgi:hypothetical protein